MQGLDGLHKTSISFSFYSLFPILSSGTITVVLTMESSSQNEKEINFYMAKQKTRDWKTIDFSIEEEIQQQREYKQHDPDKRGVQKTLNMLVDDVPYVVKVESFSFNGETRFYIGLNEGAVHVFTWDSEVGRLRAIDDQSATIPDSVEEAISQKILTWQK